MTMKDKLPYEIWLNVNYNKINIELAESGANKKLDFNIELEFAKRYNKYLIQ